MKNTEIELKHIQLELHCQRGQHLRHFIDQYFCYTNGYLNKKGNPHWEKILWNGWVSEKALEVKDRKLVVKEHIIPLRVIKTKLLDLGPSCSIDQIKEIIDFNLHFATITKEEDALLRVAGLNHSMPGEYYDPKSALFEDIFARYKVVGIQCLNKKV